ncbi:unnamed protein product [Cuscuta campestris]|uniref:Uncharacterized protein n=1 Tax=Cuscuta campestris TaxID=132261 RepID=A0A484MJH9_9ASTE|nr:unnamed protein product [Cuscuta campestris]
MDDGEVLEDAKDLDDDEEVIVPDSEEGYDDEEVIVPGYEEGVNDEDLVVLDSLDLDLKMWTMMKIVMLMSP